MPGSPDEAWSYLERRFGVSREDFDHLEMRKNSGDWWVTSGDEPELHAETAGFRAVRELETGPKPTTYVLQMLSGSITRNVFEPSRRELVDLLRRKRMIDAELESDGYVALRFSDRILGCGFFMDGVVSSRVSKGRGEELARMMEQ